MRTVFFSFASFGFAARFIIALIILSYLYSKDKQDPSLRKGLHWLVVLGVIFFAISIFFWISLITFGGIGAAFAFLGNSLPRFH